MKRFLFLAIALLYLASYGSNIHWIMFVDTNDASLGKDNQNGKLALEQDFIAKVNSALAEKGYMSKRYTYTGKHVNPQKCNQVIQQITCNPTDIVVFYYIGHGQRAKKNAAQNQWPDIMFYANNKNTISLLDIHNRLKSKKPQLLLTIGMCCNNPPFSQQSQGKLSYQRRGSGKVSPKFAKLIQDWFLSSKGDIIVSAAAKDEQANGGMLYNGKEMDFFTGTLCMLMNDYAAFPERMVTWEKFLRTLSSKTTSNLLEVFPGENQHPIYKINTTPIYNKY